MSSSKEILAEEVIQLIGDRFDVEDVFTFDQIIEYLKCKYTIEEVYSKKELSAWAGDNDFIHIDDLNQAGYYHKDDIAEFN